MVTWSSSSSSEKLSTRRPNGTTLQLAVHGPSVELHCDAPELDAGMARMLAPFIVSALPDGMGVIRGSVRRYNEAEVIRRLPTTAQPLHRPGDLTEIYAQDERFWT